jgi:hypothetical protein
MSMFKALQLLTTFWYELAYPCLKNPSHLAFYISYLMCSLQVLSTPYTRSWWFMINIVDQLQQASWMVAKVLNVLYLFQHWCKHGFCDRMNGERLEILRMYMSSISKSYLILSYDGSFCCWKHLKFLNHWSCIARIFAYTCGEVSKIRGLKWMGKPIM